MPDKTPPPHLSQQFWVLQAAYLDTLGGSHVRWHLAERTLGALLKAKPELWEVMVAAALETGVLCSESFFMRCDALFSFLMLLCCGPPPHDGQVLD